MNFKKFSIVFLALIFILSFTLVACNDKKSNPTDPFDLKFVENISSDSLHVQKVDRLSENFVMGMDASSVPSLEASGVKFYDYDGKETDVFKILANNGVNTIRVRVWNNPYDENGNGFGGGNCDIETAVEIGKRANKYGMNLMVDFHYSDFWADPSKQMVPRAWKGMNADEKGEALYEYTKASLLRLKEEKIRVSMVQVGNEINGKMAGETIWANIATLLENGSKAIREIYPNALIVLHFANPEKVTNYQDYSFKLDYYEIDYDVFASSYYPYWHGTLENLSNVLGEIATKYNKKVMVAETSYAFTDEDSDFFGNTIGAGSGVTKPYPYTIQGQANSVRNVIDAVAHTTNGIGVCYWEGTWITVGGADYDANKAIWEKQGSGWASSYSAVYDPNDAGKYAGGCAVDNQAFFDAKGNVLESLKVFGLAHKGNTVENKADALQDVTVICDLKEELVLPKTVDAIMLDDSRSALPVVWNITDEQIDAMHKNGVKKYEITGTAGGMTAHCYVSMIKKNFLTNYSFEDDENRTLQPNGWNVISDAQPAKGKLELHVEKDKNNSVTGENHYHFWGSDKNSINFDLEQEVSNLSAGSYSYSISISGGDGGATKIYAYVKINGEIVKQASLSLKGYQKWDTALLADIEYNGTDTIVVGIHVECEGTGAGAWGKIDDALLNSMGD